MNSMNGERGLFNDWWTRLFGEQASRLSERLQPSHWLSYVLILSQSAAVLLVFGHAELPLLASPSWAIRSIAAMGLFVLVATVFAADMALLETLRRIPVLARNRQRWALREHLAYTFFVLVTEAVTLGVVLSTLDADPLALISARPLIPPQGFAFHAQIVLRVTLISWSAIQLVIVRGKLPVLLSTLTGTGKEIVGAHVEGRLAALKIHDISLPAAFKVYAAMSKPPRRIRTAFNGWLLRRELAQEAEEQRQVDNVIAALRELELHQTAHEPARTGINTQGSPVSPSESYPAWAQDDTGMAQQAEMTNHTSYAPEAVQRDAGAQGDGDNPDPDGPSTPPAHPHRQEEPDGGEQDAGITSHAPSLALVPRRSARAAGDMGITDRDKQRTMAFALLDADPNMSRNALRKALKCRQQTASTLFAEWQREQRRARAAR